MAETGKAGVRAAAAVAALVAVLLALYGSWKASPTDDEPTYLGQGAYILRSGDFDAPVLLWQPPLALYLSSAALPTVDLPPAVFDSPPPDDSLTALGDRLLFESPSPPQEVLRAARLPVALVFGIGAALAALLAGAMAGTSAAWGAGLLIAASPAFYAHAGLATTDAMAAVTALGAVAVLVWPSFGPLGVGRTVGVGAALGLALLTKHTAIAVAPVVLVGSWFLARERGASLGRTVALLGVAVLTAFVVTWAGYGFSVGTLVSEGSSGDLAVKLAPRVPLPREWVERVVHDLPVPAPRYWQSLVFQAAKQHDRLFFRFFGETAKVGWWTYFPVVTAGKATLGSLALCALAILPVLRARRMDLSQWTLVAATVVPFGAAVLSRHNLGVRHVLPALAPLFVLVPVLLAGLESGLLRKIVLALLAVHCTEGLSALPHPVSWWNAAAGGEPGGWRIAEKANADWGQGLWELRDLVREEGLKPMYVFAHAPRSAREHIGEPAITFLDWWRRPDIPAEGWLAISTSAPWLEGRPPHTTAAPERFVAGCYRLYRLPLGR